MKVPRISFGLKLVEGPSPLPLGMRHFRILTSSFRTPEYQSATWAAGRPSLQWTVVSVGKLELEVSRECTLGLGGLEAILTVACRACLGRMQKTSLNDDRRKMWCEYLAPSNH